MQEVVKQHMGSMNRDIGKVMNFLHLLAMPERDGEEGAVDFTKGIRAENVSFTYPGSMRKCGKRRYSGMKDDLMLIGEIAEFFGVSRKAMRLYEKKGIIKPVKVDAANGYRYYSARKRQILQDIKRNVWKIL